MESGRGLRAGMELGKELRVKVEAGRELGMGSAGVGTTPGDVLFFSFPQATAPSFR